MAKMDTKQVMDGFFAMFPPEVARKNRTHIDRPEVYAYEEKFGKQIFDMDVDELIGLMLSFSVRRLSGGGSAISYSTFDGIVSLFRRLWNWYIENVDVIKNPWNDKRLRGRELVKLYADNREAFSYDTIKRVIARMYQEYEGESSEYAKYLECLMLLFYNGFAESQEIVSFTEDMIDFVNHTITIPRTTIHLSDRCFELLQYVHSLKQIPTLRRTLAAVPYHDGYFKVAIAQSEVDTFQEKSLKEAGGTLVRKISANVKNKYNITINYRMIYLTGFYDYIVGQVGKERANEMITSVRVDQDIQDLLQLAKKYGFASDNVTYIKRQLRPFIV